LAVGLSGLSAVHGQPQNKPGLCVALPASNPSDRLNQLLRGVLRRVSLDTVTVTVLESCSTATSSVLDGINLQPRGDALVISGTMRSSAAGEPLRVRCEPCLASLRKALDQKLDHEAESIVERAVGLLMNQAVADWRWTPLAIFKVRTCRADLLSVKAEVEQLQSVGHVMATALDNIAYYRAGLEDQLQGQSMWKLLPFFFLTRSVASSSSGTQAEFEYCSAHVDNEKRRFSQLCGNPGNHFILFPYYFVDRSLINQEQGERRTLQPPGYIAAGLPKYLGSTKSLKESGHQP
jgi:hypothetical protein